MGQTSLSSSATIPKLDDLFVLGQVGRPFGVKGWVHIRSFTEDPDTLFSYPVWVLSKASNKQVLSCLEYKPHAQHYIAKLEGIADRDKAALLSNADIAVPRIYLPALPEGSYYWQDLEGFQVFNRLDQQVMGVVKGFIETKASYPTLLVSHPSTGQQSLIPYVESAYGILVNLEAKQIELDWVWED